MSRVRLSGLLVLMTVATLPLVADTIVMRDGRRLSGTLISVRDDNRGPFEARGSGRPYLGVNDDYLQDNSGTFRVAISY